MLTHELQEAHTMCNGRRHLTAVLFAVCLGVACAAAGGTAELLAAGTEPVRVVCLGDSVTGVYYHTGGRRAYPEMLELALKRLYPNAQVQVFNAGISGNTTIDGLNRFEADVLAHKPQLVTVMFGLNDMTRVPLETYEANLAAMIQKCRAAGAETLLCTPNAVIDTPSRPTARLLEYVAAMRRVGERERTPVVDAYAACESVRAEDAFQWLLTMSDEIHPNMTGHKLFAEKIAQAISGRPVSLADAGPPEPLLPHTLALLKEKKPLRIHAMPPFDHLAAEAMKILAPEAQVEVSTWNVEGQSLAQIEAAAKAVRELKPDWVIVAVPASAAAENKEQFVRSYKWVLNYALSFAHQEWDCIAIPPSVSSPELTPEAQNRDRLERILIRSQDLGIVERPAGDTRPPLELFTAWLREQVIRQGAGMNP